MAAFRNQHRIGDLLAAPHPADESVRRAVQPHGGEVADRDDPAQLARVDDLLDLDEVGMVSQDVAHADDDPFAPGRFGDTAAFGQRLGDRLFEQDVVTRLDGLHAGFEVHVLGRADQDGVGRNRVFEKAFVVGEALFGRQPEFRGDGVAADVVAFGDADQFQPAGVPDRVFQVFVGTVARPDGYDRDGLRLRSFAPWLSYSAVSGVCSSSRACLRSVRSASLMLNSYSP